MKKALNNSITIIATNAISNPPIALLYVLMKKSGYIYTNMDIKTNIRLTISIVLLIYGLNSGDFIYTQKVPLIKSTKSA